MIKGQHLSNSTREDVTARSGQQHDGGREVVEPAPPPAGQGRPSAPRWWPAVALAVAVVLGFVLWPRGPWELQPVDPTGDRLGGATSTTVPGGGGEDPADDDPDVEPGTDGGREEAADDGRRDPDDRARPDADEEPSAPATESPTRIELFAGAERYLALDFEQHRPGPYRHGELRRDFDQYRFTGMGLEGGNRHVEIVDDPDGRQGQVLMAVFPEQTVQTGGGWWEVRFPDVDEAWLRYKVRFDDGFQFSRLGGKLPGLGAASPSFEWDSGDRRPPQHCMDVEADGGFSARHTWKRGGKLAQYLYHEHKRDRCGDVNLVAGGDEVLRRGRWQTIVQRVVMNDPGQRNGRIDTWIDGHHGASTDLELRRTDAYGVNTFIFNTYLGGNRKGHYHSREERIYYDDIELWFPPSAGAGS